MCLRWRGPYHILFHRRAHQSAQTSWFNLPKQKTALILLAETPCRAPEIQLLAFFRKLIIFGDMAIKF